MFSLSNFLNDNSFQIYYKNNYLNIYNYNKLNNINETFIDLTYNDNNYLYIIGHSLRVVKLLKKEIVIEGFITNISFS